MLARSLSKKAFFKGRKIVLNVVLDGIGITAMKEGNAFMTAHTPTLDKLKKDSSYREILAHGTHVGLPFDSDMGNSEVGHNTLGAGNIYPQGAKLVNLAIEKDQISQNKNWLKAIHQVEKHASKLHFIGLLSDGNVHSHINHLKYLVTQAAKKKIANIFIHALLDGRDADPHSSLRFLADLDSFFKKTKEKHGILPKIASFGGRMVIVMDRYEADWKMVEKGWQIMVEGHGNKCSNALEKVREVKKANPELSDQYIPPHVITNHSGKPLATVDDHDSVVFFNFRGDRAIEICHAFENESLPQIKKKKHPKIFFMSLLEYDADRKIPKNFLVDPPEINGVIGEYLAKSNVSLFALSETQKFGHVTYFWNGNRANKFNEELEDYIEIKSDNIPFDQRPWMKSAEIADEGIELIKSRNYQHGRINFPNGDMVGHTGDFNAARMAVEAVDKALGRVLTAIEEESGIAIVLADHGNCEEMYQFDAKQKKLKIDAWGKPLPKNSHTTNRVPIYIYDPLYDNEYKWREMTDAGLSNVAATTLELMNFAPPVHFRRSLLQWDKLKTKEDKHG